MGTHAHIFLHRESQIFCKLYIQLDGYPEFLGKKLADFLCEKQTGYGSHIDDSKFYNNDECLFAQIVAFLKKGPRMVYLTLPDETHEEWNYYISVKDFDIVMKILYYDQPFFEGSPKEVKEYIEKKTEE